MGFGGGPKPDPKLVAAQESEAERAKQDRVTLIQSQLQGEDQARTQVYGKQTGPDDGGGTSGGWGDGGGSGVIGGWLNFVHQIVGR